MEFPKYAKGKTTGTIYELVDTVFDSSAFYRPVGTTSMMIFVPEDFEKKGPLEEFEGK